MNYKCDSCGFNWQTDRPLYCPRCASPYYHHDYGDTSLPHLSVREALRHPLVSMPFNYSPGLDDDHYQIKVYPIPKKS